MSFNNTSANKYFILFVFFSLILQTILFFFPWKIAYSELGLEALSFLGIDAFLHPNMIWNISIVITTLYFLSYLGLLFYKTWARMLLLLLTIGGGIGIAFYGVSVQSSIESMLGYFLSIIDGFIIALAFFSKVAEKFRPTISSL